MTTFVIVLLVFLYFICVGFTASGFAINENNNEASAIAKAFLSITIAPFYAPIGFGWLLFDKLYKDYKD